MLEIGAGTGALTLALLERGRGPHRDRDRSRISSRCCVRARDLARAQIVEADALELRLRGVVRRAAAGSSPGTCPYNVATPVMLRLIEMEGGPESLTVMVQKDVAERLVAAPANAGIRQPLRRRPVRDARRDRVRPLAGLVLSAAESRLERRSCWCGAPNPRSRRAISRCFGRSCAAHSRTGAKRSSIRLALALDLDRAEVLRALRSSNLSPELRGERLDLGDFARLADALAEE